LSGSNLFTGDIAVNGGALIIEASGSISNAGAVELQTGASLLVNGVLTGSGEIAVKDGATLSGTGVITSAGVSFHSGAVLSPGASPGVLSFALAAGALDLSGAANDFGYLRFELGTTSNRVVLTSGVLNLGTGFDLDDFLFEDSGGFGPGTYLLFDTGADISGSLGSNLAGNVLGFDVTLGFANGANGKDDLILTVVPEPASAGLMLGGLGFLAGVRRRSRR
jgi:hypothetical protein